MKSILYLKINIKKWLKIEVKNKSHILVMICEKPRISGEVLRDLITKFIKKFMDGITNHDGMVTRLSIG